MKEKLSVFGMTLEELNRSQFEEGTFRPIVQLAFFFFSNCVIIYIFKIWSISKQKKNTLNVLLCTS